ncbi:MAG: hypothetical protein ACK5LJ_08185 [Paracoccus sp. (in: a-proteobacteria)]
MTIEQMQVNNKALFDQVAQEINETIETIERVETVETVAKKETKKKKFFLANLKAKNAFYKLRQTQAVAYVAILAALSLFITCVGLSVALYHSNNAIESLEWKNDNQKTEIMEQRETIDDLNHDKILLDGIIDDFYNDSTLE